MNQELAKIFYNTALYLEMDEVPFKPQAYEKAAINLERLTAIMFLAGAQALELRGISKASNQAKKIHKTIREKSDFVEADRPLSVDIELVIKLMREEKI